jgi:arylsulfatase A-like enzyme
MFLTTAMIFILITVPSDAFQQPSFLIMMGDDIGWSDFSYNNGTALSPRIKEWLQQDGTIKMQDFHSGGTVCSPTRATVLTGRNHFRDCVNYVYGCSDMTECVPDFEFAPQNTFTIGDAARASNKGYTSFFGGKYHLGSFYNDSESLGGITSSPLTHGFDFFNATVEVAPTATLNCQCNSDWDKNCDFGHNGVMGHCTGGQGPDPNALPGCCFNYWWGNSSSAHGVSNFTSPTPDDDSTYNADAFIRFIEGLNGAPFLAQVSFHNCHIPFIGTPSRVSSCNSTSECEPIIPGSQPYNHQELDFYACLNELDSSVGAVLDALKRLGYYDNTMTWFTTDNGPEINCPPEGRCGSGSTGVIPAGTLHRPACSGAGSAGPLRGRKRDVWEGGHRVPGIISWPAVVSGPARESWDTVVTMDFLATIMDVLQVERPPEQANWHFDGTSIMPILRGEVPEERGIGWMYYSPILSAQNGYAYRYGKWKYTVGGISCDPSKATFNCSKEQLYDLSVDKEENFDLAETYPDVVSAIAANFTRWYNSIHDSIVNESKCKDTPTPPTPFPPSPSPSTKCNFYPGKALNGENLASGSVASAEECCGACLVTSDCVASDFVVASPMRPTFQGKTSGGTCNLKAMYNPKPESPGLNQTACQVIRV